MHPLEAIGIVVPVHNEEELLAQALDSLAHAMDWPQLNGVAVHVIVVLDNCVDRSAEIARTAASHIASSDRHHQLTVIERRFGNVGMARQSGFHEVLAQLDGLSPYAVWLATTDADSRVPGSWLICQAAQRARGVEAWAGTVRVGDWLDRAPALRAAFHRHYRMTPREGGHIHGANMGFSAAAYLRAGGFSPIVTGEDHALWQRLGDAGARRFHDTSCPVVTSARRNARAPSGFAGALDHLEESSLDLDAVRSARPSALSAEG